MADDIDRTALALGDMPIGRPGRVTGTYEKSVTGRPYILAYAITQAGSEETVAIVRVIHATRDWPADVCFGRDKAILQQRERIKRKTLEVRRLHHRQRAA